MMDSKYAHIDWRKKTLEAGGDGLVQVIEAIAQDVHEIKLSVQAMNEAFPDGPQSHRLYHELIIQNTEEKRKLRRAVEEKTISALIWVLILGVGSAIWHELLRLFGRN